MSWFIKMFHRNLKTAIFKKNRHYGDFSCIGHMIIADLVYLISLILKSPQVIWAALLGFYVYLEPCKSCPY